MPSSDMSWVRVRAGGSKVMTLEAAIDGLVSPGMALYLPTAARAAVRGLVRRFRGRQPQFTIIALRVGGSHCLDLLPAGLAKRVIGSSFGVQFPSFRPAKVMERVWDQGQVEVECWSLYNLVLRLMAGGLGVPFLPTRAMAGSDLVGFNPGCAALKSPFAGDETLVVAALHPDIAFVHALAADEYGNALVPPPVEDDLWSTRAARRGLIVLAENIVPSDFLRTQAHLVRVPAYKTLAVCHVPLAAHPDGFESGLDLGLKIERYQRDAASYQEYYEASLKAESFDAWLQRWVTGLDSHAAYLEALGQERLQSLCGRDGVEGDTDWRASYDQIPAAAEGGWNNTEMMVAATARTVCEVVLARHLHHCLVGVGNSELAACLAFYLLRRQGHPFNLVSGGGPFDFEPVPVPMYKPRTAVMNTNIVDMYGAIVGGLDRRTLALVGAAEIDIWGNINSTRSRGRFLVGSGGVNDAVSGAAESVVMMRMDARRMLPRVEFITCPGERVTRLVSDQGVFRKGPDGRFLLCAYFPTGGDDSPAAVLARAQAACGWQVELAPDLAAVAPPSEEERRLMRWLDPERKVTGRGGE